MSMRSTASTTMQFSSKYLSWDKKLVIFVKKAEEVLFSSIYAMVQENAFRMKYALIGVLIDFLQVFAFTVSEDFGWGKDYEIISSILQGPIRMFTWQVFQALFWVTVVIIVLALAVAYYVGYSFAVSDFRRVWPIKFERTITNGLLTFLFIPFLTILLVPLKDNGSGFVRNYPEIEMWGPDSLGMQMFSIIMLIIFVPFCLLLSLLNFEFSSNTRDIMARHNAWLDFAYMILKTIIVYTANLAPANTGSVYARIIILIIATFFVMVFLIAYVPYYATWMNTLRSGLFWALFGATVNAAVLVFADNPYKDLGSGISFLLHLAFTVLFGIVGALVMRIRLANLLKKENLYSYISTRQQQSVSSEMSPGPRRGSRMSANSIALRPLRGSTTSTPKSIRQKGQALTAPAKRTVEAADRSGVFGSVWRGMARFHYTISTVIRTLFLQKSGSASDDLVHLANTVFQRAIENNGDAASYLCLHYANFLLSFRLDWVAALAQIRKASTKKPGFYQRWLTYTINKRIDREKRAHRLGTNASVELMKYVEFQHGLSTARRFHLANLRYLRNFWESLLTDDGDKLMDKMSKANMMSSSTQARALHSFSRLLASFPNSPILWRSYGSFLSDIGETDEGTMAFNTADSIEERVSVMKHRVPLEGGAMSSIPTIEEAAEEVVEDAPSTHRSSIEEDQQSQHSKTKSKKTTSTNSSTSTRKLFSSITARSATGRLHSRFIQAVVIMLLVFVGNYVTSGFLIGIEDEALKSNWDVIMCRMDTILGTVAVEDLALSYLVNNTIGLDQVQWKLLPNGIDGHVKLATNYFDDLKTRVNNLFGGSRSFGYGVADVWDTAEAEIDQFPDQTTIKASLKSTIDSWLRSLIQTVDIVQSRSMTAHELWESPGLPYGVVNGISGLGDTWDHLAAAYEGALGEASNMLMIIVFSILGACVLLVIVVSIINIRPTLQEVHLDEHLCHAMLTVVPPSDIEPIVKKIYQLEHDLTMQLLENDEDSDTDGGDKVKLDADGTAADVLVSHRKQRQWAKFTKSLANTEVRLHQMATRHTKKCTEMRHLAYKYGFGMALVLFLLLGQTIEIVLTLTQDVAVSKIINYSAERIDKVGDTYALSHFLPGEIRNIFDGTWGQNVIKGLTKKTRQLTEYHNYATFGDTANDNITIAYSFIQQHQAALFKVFDPLIYQYSDELKKLLAANETTLTYADPSYNVLHRLWNDPGTLKLPLEAANRQYYDQILADNQALRTDGAIWFAFEIIALLFAYVFAVRSIVSELEEKNDSIERMLKMVPSRVITKIPIISDYLKDKVAFLDRVKEKAAQESTSDDLDDAWSSMFVEASADGYIVLNKAGEIIHHNPAAATLFAETKKDSLRHEKVEILITPGYRHAMNAAIASAAGNIGTGVSSSLMGVRRGTGESFLANVRITTVNLGRRSVLSDRDTLTIMVWRATEEAPQSMADVATAAMAVTKLQGGRESVSDMILQGMPVLVLSLSGQILEANNEAVAMIKCDDSLVNKKLAAIVDPLSASRAESLIRDTVVSKNHRATRRLVITSAVTGDSLTVKASATATRYRAVDDLKVVVVTLEDLSDLLAVEQSIRFHEQLEETLTTALPIGIITVTGSNEIALINPEASSMLGYNADTITGQEIQLLFKDGMTGWMSVKNCSKWKRVVCKKQDGGVVVISAMAKVVGHGDIQNPDSVDGTCTTLLFLSLQEQNVSVSMEEVIQSTPKM